MTTERDIDLGAGADDWRALAAAGCRAAVSRELAPAALRFDYELAGAGDWAIARRDFAFALPAHYVLALDLRGAGAACELQVKLVEPGGASVWWWRLPQFAPPAERMRLTLRRAALAHAWGPTPAAAPSAIGAVEIAVAASVPALGALWIESARIEARPAERAPGAPMALRASSERPGNEAARARAPADEPGWRAAASDARPWLELDLGERAEHGGVSLRIADAPASELQLLESEDGEAWTSLATECLRIGSRVWLRTAAESRWLRLTLGPARGDELAELALVPLAVSLAPAAHLAALARAAPRGRYPRHLLGEHAPWALVGAEGAASKGLLGEDGAVELGPEGFSLEPFLAVDGRTLSWADVRATARLAPGGLPIPTACWEAGDLQLEVTAFAHGPSDASAVCVVYRVTNLGEARRAGMLHVAIRPFQVTPAWQSLNVVPAFAPIRELAREGARVRVNAEREVLAVSAPDAWRAEVYDAPGSPGPSAERAEDPRGFAEGRLGFAFSLAPAASESVVLAAPLTARAPGIPSGFPRADAAAWGEQRLAEATAHWRERLAGLPLALPPAAEAFEASLRASLAWMLLNRDGPRLLAGPRCYARSWIRDGAIAGVALAEFGFASELEAFLRWYAPHQLADGRVPCAVGPRGVDSAVEHDSHGQLVWALAEHWRLTGSERLLRELWPHALRAVGAIEALREPTGTPASGLLPLSISHEGYASQPVHSYWDDGFALRAAADAADAARALGDAAALARCSALRDTLRRDLAASIARQVSGRQLDFVPGSLELADFDPSATAISFELGIEDALPAAALRTGFERCAREIEARGDDGWETCTPYEMRCAFAFLRLGWPERALALLAWFVARQRPAGWKQWPEVLTRDPRAPRFLGDLPHAWAAATFVRALRRLVAYERADGVLVIGAGVPEMWLRSGDGVCARGLPTRFGPLDLSLRAAQDGAVHARLGSACRPPGGALICLPGRTAVAVAMLPADLLLPAAGARAGAEA